MTSDNKNISEIKADKETVIINTELSLFEALIPVVALISMLAYNIFFVEGQELLGAYTNQYILLISGLIAAIVGFFNKVGFSLMLKEVWENLRTVFIPIVILIMVGALSGTWLFSGIIPAMVYYGLKVLNPEVFLPASVVISIIISIATGSSWTTSATVGIALIGIGTALGVPTGMVAGAVISGAYFGDKMSPLSDTTNLAPAMAGTDLFTHIRYMTYTTIPTILITIVAFTIIGMNVNTNGNADINYLLHDIENLFHITPLLFIVPAVVVVLIVFKVKPFISLFIGVIAAAVFALIFQSDLLKSLPDSQLSTITQSIFIETSIETDNKILSELFNAKGMLGMLWTILLIISAMVFGGIMDGIGALERITEFLLKMAKSVFGLFSSTVASCMGLNILASDQYLAIVIPGKMYEKAYKDRNLAPENLSRTLEDSGTVTSALVPWNTCGAYQSSTLGVGVGEYFAYAIFNWLSPIMTLTFAAFRIKIRQLIKG
ncbi:MAG TPA: Na+/H+ antiporter NhaC [Gammaproteobacteria bacterium]|nr:Na+/H+ antiporter NhaC [Xanthomonadales bacterium]MCB1594345.1 Na+/H+ antiporter NhaC [Xanthomonadales bacterium]HOP21985.1 Na+/H+ antiporter NhaC [Gammaproteobacteria bacterium]HPI96336.1 Na+/H+ antiporter NhaC [Gammaproteobacteria bacterium]HPQ87696.1 Na+/H+ antiporter NhaC [Gammaproteobacteria bacterium]